VIAILSKPGSPPPDPALARRMLAAAPHRGDCLTVRTLGNAVLGIATRADFVDASVSADGPRIAVLAGKLDNAADLHRALTAAGTPPRSAADADVVVAAFQAYGGEAPNRMRGSFAGIVTDGRSLWAFRDHAGFRPMFYRDDPQACVAASEARQVAVGAGLREEPDLDVLEGIFYGRMPADIPAALKGVSRLAQASILIANDGTGRAVVRRYWHPERLIESGHVTPADIPERFVELVAQAAARSVTGKDAILLSGGVDSPAVAAFAAPEHLRRTGRPIGALSLVFPDMPNVDETRYITLVAEHFGIDLHTYRPTARAFDDMEQWCRLLGTPVPILSVPELADNHQRARALGYGNLMTGDFAEFLFGSPMHLVSHLFTHGRWGSIVRLLQAERRRGAARRQVVKDLLGTFIPGRLTTWYMHRRGKDASGRIPDWMDAGKVNETPFRTDLLSPARQRWADAQLTGLDLSTITLEAAEVCSVLAGVTVRRPLADIDLWEFFLGLRAEVKCPDLRYKTLARSLLRGWVPDAILDRTDKTYFDDHVMAQVDYPAMKRLFVAPQHRIPGVDYPRLMQRIEQGNFTLFDWFWAKDLAWIHAFLNQF
jgi:asparagine synthase (glutamine-hydrolysing)